MRTIVVLLAATLFGSATARAALPKTVARCDLTSIAAMAHRLQDGRTGAVMRTSGTAIELADKGHVVSYEEEPVVKEWRRGDPVMLCLASIPRNCPPGDARGRVYTVTNLRRMESITLPDAEHSCGGA